MKRKMMINPRSLVVLIWLVLLSAHWWPTAAMVSGTQRPSTSPTGTPDRDKTGHILCPCLGCLDLAPLSGGANETKPGNFFCFFHFPPPPPPPPPTPPPQSP